MKNIYEDGTFSGEAQKKSDAENGFEDIASTQKKEPVIHPTRPKKQPPQPPMSQQQQVVQPQPQYPPYYPGVPYVPYAPYPPQPQSMEQVGAYPQQMQGVPYPPYVQYQQPYYQVPAYPQPQSEVNPDAPNPGTRVLYQSADFDKPKRTDVIGKGEAYIPEGVPIVSDEQDVSIEEIHLEKKKKPAVRPTIVQSGQPDGVFVDDMEMSTFELSAMAQKRPSVSRKINQPGEQKKAKTSLKDEIEIEDFSDEGVSLEDFSDEVPEKKEKKKISVGEIIRRIVLGVSLVAIVVASGMLLNEYRLSRENKLAMDDVSNLIVEEATTADKQSTTKKNNKTDKNDTTEPTKPLTPEQQWAEIKREYPNVIFPANIQLKYAKLYATNTDFVGYLSAEGVNLSLPVVQRKDDKDEYYLKKNFYGKTTKYGCPFVTHLNNIDPLDQNTVIFGHHMNDGTVFGALDKYKTIEGFKAAPIISFNTMYKDYKWKVIAAFITNAYEKEDNGYVFRYYFTSLSTEERYSAYLNELAQRSLYDTGVDVLPSDKILTLSTCSHEFNEARFVVVARLVREGELAEVDTMRASVNPNPRYPQAYYDKKGKTNPYKNASRWEVG